ncbi:glycosyltransferase family 2 protein [Chachezhania sediminis]|uniref:glycosyltransferase family 2 protein n=1 Tax=Chachezhania sediminis TaxID=2599291 RepID=UPI001E4594CF|nr:glycosyltransferase family 2 protein [Chachezhania sediminis]
MTKEPLHPGRAGQDPGHVADAIAVRRLAGWPVPTPDGGQLHVTEALRLPSDVPGQDLVQLYLPAGTEFAVLPATPPQHELGRRGMGGGIVVTLQVSAAQAAHYPLHGVDRPIPTSRAEPDLFAGRDCVIAERNGESLATVRDWVMWHHARHGVQGVVMVDRAPPAEAEAFARDLAQALDGDVLLAGADGARSNGLMLLSLSSDLPLGKPRTGPEAHPYLAPDAPGKDRMKPPGADPWTAPLGVVSVFEIVRHRFLSQAAAVMNIDMHDILPLPEDGLVRAGDDGLQVLPATVFDAARRSDKGAVLLAGERAYPWGLRKGRPAGFGDHICRRFDRISHHRRWCIVPDRLPDGATLLLTRVLGVGAVRQTFRFYRCMALRFDGTDRLGGKVSRLVPKSCLTETPDLLRLAGALGASPQRMPEAPAYPEVPAVPQARGRVVIVTCMKNEGPFILEWLAYHRSIGVDDVLVYTNDCTDGTDTFLDLLQARGLVQRRDNPFRQTGGTKPQQTALAAADREPVVENAGWVLSMDVDEFINIHVGRGHLDDLFAAVPDANLISMTWRLFGNADVAPYRDAFVTEQFTRCAPKLIRVPHQAWGFKTLHRNQGLFRKLGVHRPKGLNPELAAQVRWVNGSGKPMPKSELRNAWRSSLQTVGYDLVTLNHYALRSAESFLVKRDRGRVNHVARDQGLHYWFRMNNNAEQDLSIQRNLPGMRAEHARLMADPEIAAAHRACVAAHRARIAELKADGEYAGLYAGITGERLRRLSTRLRHFGAAVFAAGPDVIPDEALQEALPKQYFFNVPDPKG